MPKTAIDTIPKFTDAMLLFAARESGYYGNDLIGTNIRLINKLIVADAGIIPLRRYDPMQNVFSVITLIQRDIVLFESGGRSGERHRVLSFSEHRQHTDALGRKANALPQRKLFLEDRHQLVHPDDQMLFTLHRRGPR